MQKLLSDCKTIFITFSLLTLSMLYLLELLLSWGLLSFNIILVIWSTVNSPNHTVSSSVNVSTYVYHNIEKKMSFSYMIK